MVDVNTISELCHLASEKFKKGDFAESACLYEGIAHHYEDNPSGFSQEEKASLYNFYGLALKRSGDLVQAEKIYLKSNEWTNFQIPCYVNNLAVCYYALGAYSLSQQYYLKSIKALDLCGNNRPDMALYQSNLGTLFSHTGLFKESQKYLTRSFETFECLGNQADIAHTQFQLGHLTYMMGYFSEAIKLLKTSLDGKISIYSRNHPRVADIMLVLSEVYQANRELRKAKAPALAALEIFKRTLHPNAPQIGRCYLQLAEIEILRGMAYGELRSNMRKSYSIFKQSYPSIFNPEMAHYYALRGELLMYDKKYHKAILYLNKSLQIRQGLFEPIHPILAMNYNNIGYCHAQLKQAPQAKKAYIKSLHIFKRIHRHHPWLPFLLHNIAEFYNNRMLSNICIRYGRKISREKPGLLKDAGITEPSQPVVIPEKKNQKKIQPKIKIFLIATSDMKNFRQYLSEKIIAMVNYYQGDLPELCLCEYIQGNSEKSKKVLYKMIRKESYKSFYTTFICLIGEEYGPAANLYPEIISMVPWATDYRDRADWEIILRTCIQSGTNGTIYRLGKKKVSRVDIQHPYLKVQSLIREYQHRGTFPEVEIKTMRKADQDTIEHIMFKLNLVVLQAKKRFARETFNVSVSK